MQRSNLKLLDEVKWSLPWSILKDIYRDKRIPRKDREHAAEIEFMLYTGALPGEIE